ncbi:hypothetical protein GN958_ATG12353 [Phytophthora infestans]|uniref:Uncharacterized protein n=1 Tax=Phytophthora infestans TaxID=4787 RepID=A0A8S9U9K4_PHYIN|nr:hypothetical protein GN958_ATG14841 [Phytophthora infestans]KAF4138487.1 hypothetical protein GN958_ATG12353 [Phytophthora infestans]
METHFEAIERNKKEAELLRGCRPAQRRQKHHDKPKKPAGGHRQGPQPPVRSYRNSTRPNMKQCTFCSKNVHLGTECYRNPKSASYKPRGGHAGQQGGNALAAMKDQVPRWLQ